MPDAPASAAARGAHLLALWAFAVAGPLLDVLGRNATFFVVHASTRAEIVALALGLVLVPPLALLALEQLAALAARPLRASLHLVLVGLLTAVVASRVLVAETTLSGPAALAAATGCGLAGAALYAAAAGVRALVTVLAVFPVVATALFLGRSSVADLLWVQAEDVQAATVRNGPPVVLVVFDEFPTVSLLDRPGHVDAGRFPAFAALARTSTWYRDATTSNGATERAVPTILTGTAVEGDAPPTLAAHPRNLFTLLRGRYRLRALEAVTHMCPPGACSIPSAQQSEGARTGALVRDVGIVYLHLALPDPYVSRVPSIDSSWGNYGREADAEGAADEPARAAGAACGRGVCGFTDLIDGDRRPTLYFLHAVLPHMPYVYRPSGRRDVVGSPHMPGVPNGRWVAEWPAVQAEQRYLLQLGYTDRVLGSIVRRLKQTGVWDRALVIVTADHGVSFRVGSPRRGPTLANLPDVAFVPMFVKRPHQRRASVVPGPARTVDILPTIVRTIGARVSWRFDGVPLGTGRPRHGETIWMAGAKHTRVEAPLSRLLERRGNMLREQVRRFGTHSWRRVFAIGPRPGLVGRRVAALPVRAAARGRISIEDRPLYDAVDLDSGVVPAYVRGTISGRPAGEPLAVAVNGRIGATTWSMDGEGRVSFVASVPEELFHAGSNAVTVLAVRGAGGRVVLEELRSAGAAARIVSAAGGEQLVAPGSRAVPIRPGAARGIVRASADGRSWRFTGWVAAGKRPVETIVVTVGGAEVFRSSANDVRPRRILGEPAPSPAFAFAFDLPASLLPTAGDGRSVRMLGIARGVAGEPSYAAAFPWPHA